MAKGTCSVEGCDRQTSARSMCKLHYERLRRAGQIAVRPRIVGDDERRFRFYVSPSASVACNHADLGVCWIWTGSKNAGGYGQFRADRRLQMAHRWAYERWVGPIPEGLHLDHFACDNGAGGCVNPWHCRPVTQWENNLRSNGITAIHAAKTHCPQGHPYDEANTRYMTRGGRRCRTCHREAEREARRWRRS